MVLKKSMGPRDQIVNLPLLVAEYLARGQTVSSASLDLAAAFDRVCWARLWHVLEQRSFPMHLITIIRNLYGSLTTQVVTGGSKCLTRSFPVEKGVRQVCPLAPLICNLYIDGLKEALLAAKADVPHIGQQYAPLLLYADDVVILVLTPASLQKLVYAYDSFMRDLKQKINIPKSKVFCFLPKKSLRVGPEGLKMGVLEQVNTFDYLGCRFAYDGKK